MVKKMVFLGLVFLVFPTGASFAQLDQTFNHLFDEFLRTGFKLSPGDQTAEPKNDPSFFAKPSTI